MNASRKKNISPVNDHDFLLNQDITHSPKISGPVLNNRFLTSRESAGIPITKMLKSQEGFRSVNPKTDRYPNRKLLKS